MILGSNTDIDRQSITDIEGGRCIQSGRGGIAPRIGRGDQLAGSVVAARGRRPAGEGGPGQPTRRVIEEGRGATGAVGPAE